ncbi:P2Y purinoceptor 1 isoform X2 [Pangasianodon hypophthalmus]|uniref:P2Y purinoceptor 1 isoform X2 n=1 Tax=Pangasianodon hypophthalmus TaxID=310915 RepID=UPI000EFDF1BB|nr:P2Y purinoceptor 1 isoform X2 [Pangasianodon hypophthalmus]
MARNTTNSCWTINYDFPKIFLTIVYFTVFIFGLLGNCWGLKSIFANWRKLGNINIFALNLCIADILYVLTLPFLITYQVQKQNWIFGQPFCKITRLLFNVNLYGSIGFLTCISVYRYLGIVHTLKVKGRIKARHSVGIAALVWIVVLLQCLPDVSFDKTLSNRTKCYDTTADHSMEKYLRYSITQTVIGFVIPLVLIVCCYGHIAVILATKKDIGDATLKLKCLRLVVILAVLFSICFIPIHIFRNLNLMTRISKKVNHTCKTWYPSIYIAKIISDGLACLNSAINPLVYLLNSDKLLKSFNFRRNQEEGSCSPELSPVRPTKEQSNLTYLKTL